MAEARQVGVGYGAGAVVVVAAAGAWLASCSKSPTAGEATASAAAASAPAAVVEGSGPKVVVSATAVTLNGKAAGTPPTGTKIDPAAIPELVAGLSAAAAEWKKSHVGEPLPAFVLTVDGDPMMAQVTGVALSARRAGYEAMTLRAGGRDRAVKLGQPCAKPAAADAGTESELVLHVATSGDRHRLLWKRGGSVVGSSDVDADRADAGAQVKLGVAVERAWRDGGSHQATDDAQLDQAVVLFDLDWPLSRFLRNVDAVLATERDRKVGGKVTRGPVFTAWFFLPFPKGHACAGAAQPPSPEQFGMIGLLNPGGAMHPGAPSAPWGRDTSLGTDDVSLRGNLWGDEIGDAFGAGGIGLGGIGQIGHGAGTGTGQGFGSGRATKWSKNAKVKMGAPTVSGRLPPEVIQRIVRQNYGRFRVCYEQGLARNPNLEGRVSAKFVIGRDGSVSKVSNAGSDLPDSGVVSCVVRAYYSLSFPQPEGGIVTVVFPVKFSPG